MPVLTLGGSLEDMIKNDVNAEQEAIALYKQTIKIAEEGRDITTGRLFKEILGHEEDHLDTSTKLLEK